MFTNAHHFKIKGGSFTAVNGDYTNIVHNDGNIGLQLLYQRIAGGAFHDSAERFPPPKCHPDTRKAIIRHIKRWIANPLRTTQALWLNGPAGAGKSAIAQTMAEICGENGELAASFFFSRTTRTRNSATNFLTTIAYQLALSIPAAKDIINKTIVDNPTVLDRSLQVQMNTLIIQPVCKVVEQNQMHGRGDGRPPQVVIIDGLDECRGEDDQSHILELLHGAASTPNFPLCFFIASRPEPHIHDAFHHSNVGEISHSVFLDDKFDPNSDIRLYLQSGFLDIRKKPCHKYSMQTAPHLWPSATVLNRLVKKASGQFIYASTILKFIDDPYRNPLDQLEIILGLSSLKSGSSPFADLDQLYSQILACSVDTTRTVQVLAVILVMFAGADKRPQLDVLDPEVLFILLDDILGFRKGDSYILLRGLHSLLEIPDPSGFSNHATEIRFYHASFADYLTDPSRSTTFAVDLEMAHTGITRWCLRALSLEYEFSLEDFHIKYAVSHWCYHCSKSRIVEHLIKDLRSFDTHEWILRVKSCQLLVTPLPTLPPLAFDDLLLVIRWIEIKGEQYYLEDLVLKFYDGLKSILLTQFDDVRNPTRLLLVLRASGILNSRVGLRVGRGARANPGATSPKISKPRRNELGERKAFRFGDPIH